MWFVESIANLLPLFLLPTGMLLRIARRRSAGGDYEQALRAVDRALQRLPREVAMRTHAGEAWLLKGKIHNSLGSSADATAAMLTAHEYGSYELESLRFLAPALLQAGEESPAARRVYLDYLSQASEGDSPDRLRQNLLRLKEISQPDLRSRASSDASRKWNEHVISKKETLAWAHEHLGRVAVSQDDWKRAIVCLDRAHVLEPANHQTHRLLAYVLAKDGQFVESRRHLDSLIKVDPVEARCFCGVTCCVV